MTWSLINRNIISTVMNMIIFNNNKKISLAIKISLSQATNIFKSQLNGATMRAGTWECAYFVVDNEKKEATFVQYLATQTRKLDRLQLLLNHGYLCVSLRSITQIYTLFGNWINAFVDFL